LYFATPDLDEVLPQGLPSIAVREPPLDNLMTDIRLTLELFLHKSSITFRSDWTNPSFAPVLRKLRQAAGTNPINAIIMIRFAM
jgi:hypothetical protein